jgi:hypothetical protein
MTRVQPPKVDFPVADLNEELLSTTVAGERTLSLFVRETDYRIMSFRRFIHSLEDDCQSF